MLPTYCPGRTRQMEQNQNCRSDCNAEAVRMLRNQRSLGKDACRQWPKPCVKANLSRMAGRRLAADNGVDQSPSVDRPVSRNPSPSAGGEVQEMIPPAINRAYRRWCDELIPTPDPQEMQPVIQLLPSRNGVPVSAQPWTPAGGQLLSRSRTCRKCMPVDQPAAYAGIGCLYKC